MGPQIIYGNSFTGPAERPRVISSYPTQWDDGSGRGNHWGNAYLDEIPWAAPHATIPGVPGVYIEASYEGHKAIPGKYKFTLKMGDQTVTTDAEILANPLYPGNAAAYKEYHAVIEANEEDALAYVQIARIACRHLEDPGMAAGVLEEALSREWPHQELALLCMELVDLNWIYYRDLATARGLLVQIKECMPGTPYAANAQKRLLEINEEAAREARQ